MREEAASADAALRTDARDGHVHEVGRGVMLVPRAVVLQPLQESREHLLRDLAASSLQVGEPRESEVGVQVVGDGVEGPSDCQGLRRPSQLQLCRRR